MTAKGSKQTDSINVRNDFQLSCMTKLQERFLDLI